ncbi:PREDICTED: probable ATP-dependent RNA helicase DHX35 [Amphimedon queenslandica]|uniref:RNA helicase n=1 Tax=Amphimedon queenslandica TaxID=400682 RepID=A0A1X7VFA5_AMPQE|nr:PREDICTED: probable ATP-dependent RNA helicase DHX35 [Amphimedon queenslandica]|eukprot:XP_003384417.3 PREDICTED: probable ATP-dependent RNA helicase DHX35 [Amphimedon queenslandica]
MATSNKFWKPGGSRPSGQVELERAKQGSEGAGSCMTFNTHLHLPISQQRQRLPIARYREQILYLVEKYRTVVIVGETGSGKTTQIPQYLHEANWTGNGYIVAVTQPRRIAVTTVASRVADERGVVLGHEVGYSIRFDDCTDSKGTRIKFLTDGMLTREMMWDPLLLKYSVVMLDEAHERNINTDIVIGLLKKIMKKRDDFHLIISSATLDAELFKSYFETNTDRADPRKDTAVIMTIEGRAFDIDIHHTKLPVADYVKSTVDTALAIHREEPTGDILAFLTGQEEVETAVKLLKEHAERVTKGLQLLPLPLYGGLPYSEQIQVFQRTPPNSRKVIVSTNIAETSVTINGIVYVIDCGFVKLKAFSPQTSLESLVIVPISQSSALQRSGRAGRVRSGKVYRLYTEESYRALDVTTVPEVQRSSMAPVVLQLKALGIDNVLRFNYLSPPPAESLLQGLELLYALGALDDEGKLTNPLGMQMAEFPLNPMFARMLLLSESFGCSEEILTITAMLQVNHAFHQPTRQKANASQAKRKFCVYEGDHLTLLNVYNAFIRYNQDPRWCQQNFIHYKSLCHAVSIREQLKRLLHRFKIKLVSCHDDPIPIQKCIVSGFFVHAARLHYTGTCYKTIRGNHTLHIHPSSILFEERSPQWVVFNEVLQTSSLFMRDVTVVDPEWLYQLAPHFYQYGTEREIAESKKQKLEDLPVIT